jgi:galactonate dehydratase
VRKAVGDDFDLLIEGHDRFSVSTAIRIGKKLEEFHPMWFETPVMSTDITATIEVARAIGVPVASGERFWRLTEVFDLVASRVVSIVQPETLRIGGISGARKACAIAEACEAFIALHQAQSPLTTAVNTHIHATIPNFLIQENFDDFLEPWAHDVVRGTPRVKDGVVEPPDLPGLGIEMDEAEMLKHPYGADNFLRLFEDGWETRRR